MANTDYIIPHRYCYIKTASAGVTLTLGISGESMSFQGGELSIDFGDDPDKRPPKVAIESTSTVRFSPFKIERIFNTD